MEQVAVSLVNHRAAIFIGAYPPLLAALEPAVMSSSHLAAALWTGYRHIYMENFKGAVGTVLGVLSGFHLDHGLVRSLINNCWKTFLASVPHIFNTGA